MSIQESVKEVKAASVVLAAVETERKNSALRAIQEALLERKQEIIKANNKDLERSEKEKLDPPLLKRLKFQEDKIQGVVDGIESLIQLKDPVGETLQSTAIDEDLELYKVSCPIGVIGVIFESRPDALVQISTLCLKSGNGVLLKGGSEAKETNRILFEIIRQAAEQAEIPKGWIQLMETRDDVNVMLKMDDDIDLIIPRGSNDFVKYIMDHSNIPVLGHADGICHLYIDGEAEVEMALSIAVDSKTQYVSVCNATETLLIDRKIAKELLPSLRDRLKEKDVTIVGDEEVAAVIDVDEKAGEQDWKTEYLDYKIAIKTVDGLEEA
ncbi:MAG TPA: glutamate-5-semialdehyde dehydrogenase, partial [Eubacteriaceae bacterium]|nr:glutamate-5-semialdehyde dehydrogenase [Eubacteriaceae bacterium]